MGARWLARAEGLWSCPQSLPWLSWPLEEGVSRGFGAVAGSVRPTVTGRADVGIGTGPLESALPLIPRDAYARPLSSARIAGAIPRGVLGRLVAAGGSDCVIWGGPLSEARVARVPALWQCLGWLVQGGQCTLTGGVVEFLAVVAGEAGIVSLVRHNSEQGRVQHVPRCGLFLRNMQSYFSQPVPPCLCPSLTMKRMYAIMSRVRSGCFCATIAAYVEKHDTHVTILVISRCSGFVD